jgi:hypothetical protein
VLPTLWFRNRGPGAGQSAPVASGRRQVRRGAGDRADLGERYLYCDGQASLAVHRKRNQCEAAVWRQNRTPFVKDGINSFIVHGQADAVNPQKTGTKAAAHYRLTVPPGKCEVVRFGLTPVRRAWTILRQGQSVRSANISTR